MPKTRHSIEEIESLFTHEIYVTPDKKHSGAEQRFISVGISRNERRVFMIFTVRRRGDEVLIRPISARYMHKQEVDAYEKAISRI
jgi:uncharacterized DUF497 family protein